jgi:hypothetical protein
MQHFRSVVEAIPAPGVRARSSITKSSGTRGVHQLGAVHGHAVLPAGTSAFVAGDLREGQLKHLGVPLAPKKPTLAYANEHRPWQLFQTVFEQMLSQCQFEHP